MDVTLNGARIHFERAGSGIPLVLLHAGVADHRMWDPQADAFARHFDVIRPDLRGFGDSELPPQPWSPVDDLLALMDELGLKPAHLVGCSLGAGAAIDFALQHSERVSRLVLVGPGISGADFGANHPGVFAEVETAEQANDFAALNLAEMHLWLDGPRRPHGHVRQPLRDLFLDMNGKNSGADFEKAPITAIDPPAAGRLHEITAPTLVVIGDEDVPMVFDAADLLMSSLSQARKAVIHDAAHLPNLEHPEEFNRLVLDFLLED